MVPPVSEQFISRQGFFERERKRLTTAEEAVLAAVKSWDERVEASAVGEKRLEELQSQEPFCRSRWRRRGRVGSPPSPSGRISRIHESCRTATHEGQSSGGPARFDSSGALSRDDRQKDVQEALSTGDDNRVVELSSMLIKGAERMVEMSRLETSNDEFRSRTAPEEGRFAPY